MRATSLWVTGLLALALAVGCSKEEAAADPADAAAGGAGGGAGGVGGAGGAGGAGGEGGQAQVTLDAVEITPSKAALNVDDVVTFTATARYSDGSTQPVATPQFAVNDERIFAIEGEQFTAVAGGPIEVSTTVDGVTGTWSGTVKCGEYPFYQDILRYGSNAPPLNWPDAYRPDGTQFHFSLDDFRCFADYQDKDTLLIVMTAGWCPACTQWKLLLDKWLPQLEGMQILYVVSQTADGGNNATADYAQQHVSRLIGDHHGIRVGGVGTFIEDTPMDNFIHFQDFVEFFPTNWVVRKRDMRVITDSLQAPGQILPLSDIARDPEADYRRPRGLQFNADCGEADEEPTDGQNDFFDQAPVIEPGTHAGALCNENYDYYRVNIDGPWRATLRFTHTDGDLSLYVYQRRADGRGFEPAPNGRSGLIGSDTNEDVETFEHRGPATLGVAGFLGAQGGRYTLELEAL
ncbi:MAG: hypothetical protein H6702_10080 [Myxococcales bacterium]|nr:hypothetical protein [Myxococcales bacterium]